MDQPKHIPVLLQDVLRSLNPKPGESYLDLTAGYGGHAKEIAKLVGDKGKITLVDRDEAAVKSLKEIFAGSPNVQIMHQDFFSASKKLKESGAKFDMILADLGVSSQHFNNPNRGFSFSKTGPLDMRMDQSQNISAFEIVNESSKEDLAAILKKYGEVKNSLLIAEKLIERRPYKTTLDLSNRLAQILPRRRKIDPSTLVFQAIRIAVNDELTQLKNSLPIWLELLNKNGRIGIISFHSLEDRIVKQFMRENGGDRYDAQLHLPQKKPVTAAKEELVYNPRARSAKLRSAQRK